MRSGDSPLALPTALAIVQVVSTFVALGLLYSLLPSDAQQPLAHIYAALRLSLREPLNMVLHQKVAAFIGEEVSVWSEQGFFWIWIGGGVLCGALVAWVVQMLVTGLLPRWRYSLAIAVAACVGVGCAAFGRLTGSAAIGVAAALVSVPLAGWIVATGRRRSEDRPTDARTIRSALNFGKPFDPLRYMRPEKRGVFFGLDQDGRAVYVSLEDARKHVQLVGETRTGKTVAATVLLAQCAALRECVVIFDPKADTHAPMVMQEAARRAGVPFVYLDLRPDQPPQLSLLHGATAADVEEMLIDCFDLKSKGTDADVYRVEDRAAARAIAASGAQTFSEMMRIASSDPTVREARKFMEDLREIAAHPVINTMQGLRLQDVVSRPCVLYVVGSTRHDNTIRLQKLVLMRLAQLIDRKTVRDPWTAIFLDEFKYLLSPAALAVLGTISHRRCHIVIAHQSNGDLKDCGSLDPNAVYGAVVVNTGLKIIYKVNDPATAQWAADLSGEIPAYIETIAKNPAVSPGAFAERSRPLIDRNMLLALPARTGMLFGAGVAKLVHVHYLPKSKVPPAVRPAPAAPNTVAASTPDALI